MQESGDDGRSFETGSPRALVDIDQRKSEPELSDNCPTKSQEHDDGRSSGRDISKLNVGYWTGSVVLLNMRHSQVQDEEIPNQVIMSRIEMNQGSHQSSRSALSNDVDESSRSALSSGSKTPPLNIAVGGVLTITVRSVGSHATTGLTIVTKEVRKVTDSVRKSVDKLTHNAFGDLFGDEYNKREGYFVLIMGALMAFNGGMINGVCVSGLLTRDGSSSVTAGLTLQYTKSGYNLASGDDWDGFRFHTFTILCYGMGAFMAGMISPDARPYRLDPSYGPSYMLGGFLLLGASLAASADLNPNIVFYLAAASNGLQNGIASIYSANLIRYGLTGVTVDMFLAVGQRVRGNKKAKTWKSCVLFIIASSFWMGALVSYFTATRFLDQALFVNAAIFFLIGVAMIVFLVKNLKISVKASILGTWSWGSTKKKFGDTDKQMKDGIIPKDTLMDLFEQADVNGLGLVEPEILMNELLKHGGKVGGKQVKALVHVADKDHDGVISYDEWAYVVGKMPTSA